MTIQPAVLPGTSTEFLLAVIRNRERQAKIAEERKEKFRERIRKAKEFFGCTHGPDDRMDGSCGCYQNLSLADVLQNFS